MPTRRSKRNQAVNALEFIGERDRPMRLDKVAGLRPILATKEPPEEFLEFSMRQSIYIASASERDKPEITVQSVGRQEEQTLWRVDIPQPGGQETSHMFGQSAIRESPEFYLKGINPDASFAGYQPEWVDVLYTPRVVPDMQPSLRRINGRFLRPAQNQGPKGFVFGTDNRQPFKPSSWPWHCIGKIFTSEGKVCSGALVGHNMVVTASHMVPPNAWLGIPGWWMKFVPAYYYTNSLLGIGVQSYVSQVNGWNLGWQVAGYDWAILKLSKPLGDSLGWFGVNDYSGDWEGEPWWTIVGYPGEVAGGLVPSWQSGISVIDDDDALHGGRELEHKGDVTSGNSGGPMFGWWNGTPRLIGVVSGGEYEGFFGSEAVNVTAGGAGFTSLVAWGNSNW